MNNVIDIRTRQSIQPPEHPATWLSEAAAVAREHLAATPDHLLGPAGRALKARAIADE